MKTIQQIKEDKETLRNSIIGALQTFNNDNPDLIPTIEISVHTTTFANGIEKVVTWRVDIKIEL